MRPVTFGTFSARSVLEVTAYTSALFIGNIDSFVLLCALLLLRRILALLPRPLLPTILADLLVDPGWCRFRVFFRVGNGWFLELPHPEIYVRG